MAETNFGIQGLGFVFIIVFLLVVGYFAFWAIGRVKKRVDWDGYRVDTFKIWWQTKGFFEVNLAINDNFDEETLDMLEEQAELRVAKGVIEKYKKQKKLFIYNATMTDDSEIEIEFHSKIRIVSGVQLESEIFSNRGIKERRPWSNPLEKETRRHIGFSHVTWMKTITDEDGNEVDYIFAYPIPTTEEHHYPMLRNIFLDAPVYYFQIVKEEGLKNIAELNEFMKTFKKATTYNKAIATERDMYKELYEESLKKIDDINIVNNELEEETVQHKYVDTGRDALKKKDTIGTIWIVLSAFFAGVGAITFPSIFTGIDKEIAMMLGMGVGMAMALLGFAYHMSTVKPEERTTKAKLAD